MSFDDAGSNQRRRATTELTDHPNCPYCAQEGRVKPNSCKFHRWAYRYWYEQFRRGVER